MHKLLINNFYIITSLYRIFLKSNMNYSSSSNFYNTSISGNSSVNRNHNIKQNQQSIHGLLHQIMEYQCQSFYNKEQDQEKQQMNCQQINTLIVNTNGNINNQIYLQAQKELQTNSHCLNQLLIQPENNKKNNIIPVRMFKDLMALKKQNIYKKAKVKQLENTNKKLKMDYDISLANNKKIEMFLKQIEFTLKNDRSNQKANQALMKATKTLDRQKLQYKNYIQKLIKISKTNQMRELKVYLKVLEKQRTRLTDLFAKQAQLNQKLREIQDFNKQQLVDFQYYQNLMTQILSNGLNQTISVREAYRKQKSLIHTFLSCKQTQYIKRETIKIDQNILTQLLNKQGLQYQLQLLKTAKKQKNKRSLKQQSTLLKHQINQKKKKINQLEQQLSQKIKTQQYITKWAKQLKLQLQQLKQNHKIIKQQYEQQINKLSQQIQQWNRKYKSELVQQQNVIKKVTISANKEIKGIKQNNVQEIRVKVIKVIKVWEVQHLKNRINYYLLENQIDTLGFIKNQILKNSKNITLKQLHMNLCGLEALNKQDPAQIYKLARYIVEDNNITSIQRKTQLSIQSSLALLILKNLLVSQLTPILLPQINKYLSQLLHKNFDQIRHQMWLHTGKNLSYTEVNLCHALSKYYIECPINIQKYIQYIKYKLWKIYKEIQTYKICNFQKLCEEILGKKLVKDNKNRISKTTIKSVFQKVYSNLKNGINSSNGSSSSKKDCLIDSVKQQQLQHQQKQ